MDSKDKKLKVTGDIDPVAVVPKLKKLCNPEIVTVGGPVKEPEKKEVPKKKKPCAYNSAHYQQHADYYDTQYRPPRQRVPPPLSPIPPRPPPGAAERPRPPPRRILLERPPSPSPSLSPSPPSSASSSPLPPQTPSPPPPLFNVQSAEEKPKSCVIC